MSPTLIAGCPARAYSSTAASASPGSTISTCTSSGPRAPNSRSATPRGIASAWPSWSISNRSPARTTRQPRVGRVRERFNKWIRGSAEPPAPQNPLLFTDHEEIQDIARQMARTKVEIDRSILTLRSWARDLSRRVAESGGGLEPGQDLRSLGETVGGLAHNFNNSLAAILAYTELLLRENESEAARRRLVVIRDVALEAS